MILVGKREYRLGRMIMSHMVADSIEELHLVADALDVSRRHFQDKPGKPYYDVCKMNKVKAIALGAKLVEESEIILFLRKNYISFQTVNSKL